MLNQSFQPRAFERVFQAIFDAATARASHKTSNGIPQELDKRISAGRDESTWT
jgi:hypothetical protein